MTVANDDTLAERLREIVEEFDCASGILHRAEGDELMLVAHEGFPTPSSRR